MGWSITLGTFKGTAVRVHITFLLFLAWIGFSAYQRGGPIAARDSLLFIVSIFTCVVLHEFGHILTARRYGIVSPMVTLLPIGGVADMRSMPEKPYQELLIALAGPAVNVVIAFGLIAYMGATDMTAAVQISDPGVSLIQRLAVANLFLAVFNLIPAFPMDGGRVLRAALAMWLGQAPATRIAAQIGQGLAFVFGFFGLFGHPMLIFIAIFIYIAAAGEAQMTAVAAATHDMLAADVMETQIAVIDRRATIGEAVETLIATSQDEFPVVDASGRLHGILSRADIIEALKTEGRGAPIAAFAQKDADTIAAGAAIDSALPKLAGGGSVAVIDAEGRLLGLLTRQSVVEIMMIRDASPDWRFSRQHGPRTTVA